MAMRERELPVRPAWVVCAETETDDGRTSVSLTLHHRSARNASGSGTWAPVSALATLLVLACGGEDGREAGHTVQDSAGVRIVNNFRPAWGEGDGWQVDGAPLLDISGEKDSELFRPGTPLLLTGGRVAVFSQGNCEIRFYDSLGEFLEASGGCGGGPGEYAMGGGQLLSWAGDSLLVFDYDQQRVTVLDERGRLGRTVILKNGEQMPRPRPLGLLQNGTLVLSAWTGRGPRQPGAVQEKWSLGILRDLHAEPELLGIHPGRIHEYTGRQGRIYMGFRAFGSQSAPAVGKDRIFIGFQDRYEIQILGPEGSLQQIIRRAFEPFRVGEEDVDWLRERALSRAEGAEAKRQVRRGYQELEYSEVMPAFGTPLFNAGVEEGGPDMLVDVDGHLWVFEYYRPGEYRNRFSIFSPAGVWLGTMTLPDRLKPSKIGEDFILGTVTDELGFVHIRKHRLVRQ